jgi:hypothetical protein
MASQSSFKDYLSLRRQERSVKSIYLLGDLRGVARELRAWREDPNST